MEIAGLAFGVAGLSGLFSACVDILEKVDAFRDASVTSHTSETAFKIKKLLLERWGQGVGIGRDGLISDHHPFLDDPNVAAQVGRALSDLKDLCTKIDKSLAAISRDPEGPRPLRRVPTGSVAAETKRDKTVPSNHGPSTFAKLNWVGRSQARTKSNLDLLDELLTDLFGLVPLADAQLERLLMESRARMDAEIKTAITQWLSAPWNTDVFDRSRKSRLPNTCGWILERDFFCNWLAADFPDAKPKVLWINGPAGYGKTVLCAKVVEHVSSHYDPRHVAHYFVSTETGAADAPFTIVKSWLFQLVSKSPEAFRIARQLWDPQAVPTASQEDVVRVLNSVLDGLDGCTLIADGLDECAWAQDSRAGDQNRDSASGFFGAIAEAVAQTGTRVLFFSRREEAFLKPAFHSHLAQSHLISAVEHSIITDDVHEDAKVYSQTLARKTLAKRGEDKQAELAENMLVKSEGMFLWMKMLEGDLSKANNTKKVFRAVEQAPSGIQHLYNRNWDRIANNSDSEAKAKAFSILRWAAFSSRPLTVLELIEALTIPEDDDADDLDDDELPDEMGDIDDDYVQTYIVDLCGSLVHVRRPKENNLSSSRDSGFKGNNSSPGADTDSQKIPLAPLAACDTVHIVHFSVREFLLSRLPYNEGLRPADERLANSDIGHARHLTLLCLRYLGVRRAFEEQLQLGEETHERRFLNIALEAFDSLISQSEDISTTSILARMATRIIDPRREIWALFKKHIGKILGWKEHISDHPDWPAVPFACFLGSEPLRYILSEARAPVNIADVIGFTALHLAVDPVTPCPEVAVKLLIDHGADVNASTTHGTSPLIMSVTRRQYAAARVLLEHGARQIPCDGRTPLWYAATKASMQMVQLLIDYGADVNAANEDGTTPLTGALSESQAEKEVAEFLLNRGAEAGVRDKLGETPLFHAIKSGHPVWRRLFDLTIRSESEMNATSDKGETLLHIVAHHPDNSALDIEEVMGLFLSRGANIEVVDNDGMTPLHSASCSGNNRLAELLLLRGAKVECRSLLGATPLHFAAEWGRSEILKTFIGHGVDIDAVDAQGHAAIHHAACQGNADCLRLLLDKGADLHSKDNAGATPTHYATCSANVNCLQFLLEKGADLHSKDNAGATPIYYAVWNSNADYLRLLLEKGADLNSKDNAGATPTHHAACSANVNSLQFLLEKGADLHSKDDDGATPIYYAVWDSNADCLRLLLEKGADLHSKDNNGWSAAHYATCNGKDEILKLLLEHEADCISPNHDGLTPLHMAAEMSAQAGHLECVKLLLASRANPRATSIRGHTPAHRTVFGDASPVCLKMLLEASGHPDQLDSEGRSTLHYAARSASTEMLETALQYGSTDALSQDKRGLSSLACAVAGGHEALVTRLLATIKGQFDYPDSFGRTLLWWTRRNGSSVLEQLLRREARERGVELLQPAVQLHPTERYCEPGSQIGDSYCNVCTLNIFEDELTYRCYICMSGGFFLCPECFELGAWCHVMDRGRWISDETGSVVWKRG